MRILLLFLWLLISSYSISQSVSIELAFEWNSEKVYLSDSILSEDKPIPYLVITYRNLSEEKVCLKSAFSNDEYYLPNRCASLINTNLQYDELAMRIGSYSGESYVFSISESIANYDTLNQSIEHESAVVNDDLFYLYCVLSLQKQLNDRGIGKQLRCFSYPDKNYVNYNEAKRLLSNNALIKMKQTPIFILNPKEVKQQKLSLIGMLLAGGTFSFKIDDLGILIPNTAVSLKKESCTVLSKENILTNVVRISF